MSVKKVEETLRALRPEREARLAAFPGAEQE
jgi:hypothetical protein